MDTSTEQIVEYVRGYGVPINVLFFEYLDDGDREYLARSWLTDPELDVPSSGGGKKQAPWSGEDFFVAVGESEERNWDDMVRYGFVSAGHGDKYRKAMETLFEGARVWAAIPSSRAAGSAHGYVGVGRGRRQPSACVTSMSWIDVRPRDRAVWEKGMFANQNVVAKLRQPFTLQRLSEAFDPDGPSSN
jgi:hypothetical protein